LEVLLILAIAPPFLPKKRVLILAFLDCRPVVASKKRLGELGEIYSFPGHLILEKLKKQKWSEDKVSSSVCQYSSSLTSFFSWCWLVSE